MKEQSDRSGEVGYLHFLEKASKNGGILVLKPEGIELKIGLPGRLVRTLLVYMKAKQVDEKRPDLPSQLCGHRSYEQVREVLSKHPDSQGDLDIQSVTRYVSEIRAAVKHAAQEKGVAAPSVLAERRVRLLVTIVPMPLDNLEPDWGRGDPQPGTAPLFAKNE